MKKAIKSVVLLAAFVLTAGLSFGQSNNLKGKAIAAAGDCIQSFDFNGLGLKTKTSVNEIGKCPDGSPKYAVTISKVGHCPQNQAILCLVVSFPVATVTFDCDENVESVECFNSN